MTTIKAVLTGGEMGVLRAVVCGTSGIISWPKGQTQEHLVKIGLRDATGYMTALAFNPRVFESLMNAARNKHFIKIEGYRRSDRTNTLILGKDCSVSVLMGKQHTLTDKEVEEARISMYATMQPIEEALKSPNKARVSTSGKIVKVYPADSKCKKVLLKSFNSDVESLVTMWQPHHDILAEVGQTMKLYDAKKSSYQGGSLDTSAGTSIEIQEAPVEVLEMSGTLVAFGVRGTEDLLEIVLTGEEDEKAFTVSREIMLQLNQVALPTKLKFTTVNGVIRNIIENWD